MISFEEDAYIQNMYEGNTRWIVTLNDGRSVYQDDGRPGLDKESAWERLYYFCQETGLYITGMRLQFRSHVEHLEPNKEGYFFCKSILGSPFMEKNFHYFVAGYLENGIIYTRTWKIPELIVYEEERRIPKDQDVCLIRRKQ